MRRLRARWIVPALAAAVITLVVPGAAAAKPGHTEPRAKHAKTKRVGGGQAARAATRKAAAAREVERRRLVSVVVQERSYTWTWQDRAGQHRWKTEHGERRVQGLGYLRWQVHLWHARHLAAKTLVRQIERQWAAMSRDFETAVRVLAHRLGLDPIAGWVLSCADSEGGRGVWVYRGHALLNPAEIYRDRQGNLVTDRNVPGGWMQFFPSTLYNNIDAAYDFARSRKLRVPSEYRSWFSPVGQALTALWMFHHEGSGQWTGAGC